MGGFTLRAARAATKTCCLDLVLNKERAADDIRDNMVGWVFFLKLKVDVSLRLLPLLLDGSFGWRGKWGEGEKGRDLSY